MTYVIASLTREGLDTFLSIRKQCTCLPHYETYYQFQLPVFALALFIVWNTYHSFGIWIMKFLSYSFTKWWNMETMMRTKIQINFLKTRHKNQEELNPSTFFPQKYMLLKWPVALPVGVHPKIQTYLANVPKCR